MSDWPSGSEWGNDWNHNGEYDSFDNYMDYEMFHRDESSGGSGGGGGRGGSSTEKTWLVVFVIALVLGIVNELLGAIVLFGFLYYEMFLK